MRRYAVALFWLAVATALVFALLPQAQSLAIPGNPSDKMLHILAFTVMAGLGGIAYPKVPTLHLLAYLSLFGAVIEVLQMIPALERDAEFGDWIADSSAASIVLLVLQPIIRRLIRV